MQFLETTQNVLSLWQKYNVTIHIFKCRISPVFWSSGRWCIWNSICCEEKALVGSLLYEPMRMNLWPFSYSCSSGRRGLKENIIAPWWEKLPSHCRAPRNFYRTWLNVLLSLCPYVQILQAGAHGHHGMKVKGLATTRCMQSPVSCGVGWWGQVVSQLSLTTSKPFMSHLIAGRSWKTWTQTLRWQLW